MRRAALGRELSLLTILVAVGGMYAGASTIPSASVATRAASMLGAASVSISAAIPANPDNTLARKLSEKQAELDAREAALLQPARSGFDWGFLAFILSAGLLVLVIINFYLDIRRMQALVASRTYAVDLRY